MDWAQIIVILLCIILGILIIAAISLVVSFLLLTHKIRKTAADTRSLAENIARLAKMGRMVTSTAASIKAVAVAIQKKKKKGGIWWPTSSKR